MVTRPRFGILGPLQVLEGERVVDPGSRKQQIVLAALLCHANSIVTVDCLIEALWYDVPPRTARKAIQVYVSALRSLVGPRISYHTSGYLFHAQAAELDSLCFQQRARASHRLSQTGPSVVAARVLADALDLWRGKALDGMRDVSLLRTAAERLERQFLTVFEDWAEAQIAAGGGADTIERIAEVVHEHPLRERLRTLQMAALCQTGRRAEALAVYDELRRALAHELGLSPSPAVVRCYEWVLREQEPTAPLLAVPPPSGPVSPNLLPKDLPAFTGRAESSRELADALVRDGNKLAVVTGPPGAGKTALAIHTAHQIGDSFPDGRFFVGLRGADGTPRPLSEVVSRLLWVVTSGSRQGESPTGELRVWHLWLSVHRALVILDGARRESEVRPLLPDSGNSALIVTSQFRLAGLDAAYRLRVPSFTVGEAVEFLGRMIGAGRVAADRRSAEQIVAAAGLLPLGIRLVAERLALLGHVPLREYAARMADASVLLDELTAGDVAIRSRLARAIGDLPEFAHSAVPRLGMLPERVFTLSQAAAVLDSDEGAVVRVLESLLEASIIRVPSVEELAHTVRYEIPVLLYAYAREMAAARPDAGLPGSRCE